MAARRVRRVGIGVVVGILLVLVLLTVPKGRHPGVPTSIGTGCLVRGSGYGLPLSADQAGIAATIAGVARHLSLPVRAVTIAYAAALQESDLLNLPYGDRDSVGIFQQRPSQGWGTRQQLLDPVYATSRFFGALVKVPRYQHLRVYQAAQAVQRSADGYAYSQYSTQGALMASGFTGQQPRAVWCWYSGGISGRPRLAAAQAQLSRTFGPLQISGTSDPTIQVRAPDSTLGWSVASWLVTHAAQFRIKSISYDGYQWAVKGGQYGWRKPTPGKQRARARRAANHAATSHGATVHATANHRSHSVGPAARLVVVFG